jgi:hypothetical protein
MSGINELQHFCRGFTRGFSVSPVVFHADAQKVSKKP